MMIGLARRVIPKPMRRRLNKVRYGLEKVNYRIQTFRRLGGLYPRECNICGYVGLFAYFGDPPRRDARCKGCDSVERHRLLKLWVDRNQDRLKGTTVLHFAPEPAIRNMVKPLAGRYVSADIMPGLADIVLDIEAIAQPDRSFDWIICSHVLEHIDDAKALPELYRVLKPGGILSIMVPIVEGWDRTYENSAINGEAARDLHFGQYNHVRYYGHDLRDRIAAAGFDLTEITAVEPDVSKFGLMRGEKIFVATRRADGAR